MRECFVLIRRSASFFTLAFLGRDGGKRGHGLGHALAAAVRAHEASLFEIRDMENLGELLVAIPIKKAIVRHYRSPLHQPADNDVTADRN